MSDPFEQIAREIESNITEGLDIDDESKMVSLGLRGAARIVRSHAGRFKPDQELRRLAQALRDSLAGPGRCPWCSWPLKATAVEGCIAGNCSLRPLPSEMKWTRTVAAIDSYLSAPAAPATVETCDCAQAEPLFVRALLRHWQSVGTNSAVEHEREAIFAWVLKHRKCPAVDAAIRQLERDTVAGLSTLDGHVPSSTPTPPGRVIASGEVRSFTDYSVSVRLRDDYGSIVVPNENKVDVKVGQRVAIVEKP